MLVVWSDNLDNIIDLCREFEEKLIKLVWRSRNLLLAPSPPTDSSLSSTTSSKVNLNEKQAGTTTDVVVVPDRDKPAPRKTRRAWSWKPSPPPDRKKTEARAEEASEKGAVSKNPRPIRLFASVYGGLGVALSICQFSVLFLSLSLSLISFSLHRNEHKPAPAGIQVGRQLYQVCPRSHHPLLGLRLPRKSLPVLVGR